MPVASWNGVVIADAADDEVAIVDNNVYFPLERVRQEYLQPSTHHSSCPWKGVASYYDLVVDGQVNQNAVWTYRTPFDAAAQIRDKVAFWKGVQVQR